MSRQKMAALNRGKVKVGQRTWIAASAFLLLAPAILVPLSAAPPSNDDKNREEASWLDEKWSTSRTFWKEAAAKARWQSIPWLRMTPEKKHALWDEALRYALVEDDWLGRPSGEIPVRRSDPEYTPSVPGLTFRLWKLLKSKRWLRNTANSLTLESGALPLGSKNSRRFGQV